MVAAIGSIPLGRASDVWGRRPLMLGAMALSVVTSLLLPVFEGQFALMVIYGLAGLGVAAFTPSALSLVGDAAPPDSIGHAYAWYSTAHYGAIGIGPFLGGLVAEQWGYRAAFVVSAIGIAIALAVGHAMLVRPATHASPRASSTFADIKGNTSPLMPRPSAADPRSPACPSAPASLTCAARRGVQAGFMAEAVSTRRRSVLQSAFRWHRQEAHMAATVRDAIRELMAQSAATIDALLEASDRELAMPSSHACAQGKDVWALITNDIDHEKIHVGQILEARYESGITASPMQRLVAEWLAERGRFIGSLIGLTDEQFNRETAPGQWTYRVVAKHVLTLEQDSLKTIASDQAARASHD